MVIIHWQGPFYAVDELAGEFGLYFLTGKLKRQRNADIQYFGITEGSFRTRLSNHHKIHEVKRDLGIWLGKIKYPQNASYSHLCIAEKMLIYFWQPSLNERKWYTPPGPTTLISHWFTPNGQPLYRQKAIYKELSDVLCWDGELWRTGNLAVYPDEEWE